jgi:hypothetical protein
MGHELAVGLTGVYDSGYDRGLHYAASYQFSWRFLYVGALVGFGDTDPRRQQQWGIFCGVQPWKSFRLTLGLRHHSYPPYGFGENLILFVASLQWRGAEFTGGQVMRFPIIDADAIHHPLRFDTTFFEHFLVFRVGYVGQLGRGWGLGFVAGNYARFEIQNLDYPQVALVVSYADDTVGSFRLDLGIGTAGFFNQGATIDRGFVRLEYVRNGW